MKTILLIIKSGDSYIRIREDGYHLVGLDKASVFPGEQLETVREHFDEMALLGFEDLCIKKLKIREEEL